MCSCLAAPLHLWNFAMALTVSSWLHVSSLRVSTGVSISGSMAIRISLHVRRMRLRSCAFRMSYRPQPSMLPIAKHAANSQACCCAVWTSCFVGCFHANFAGCVHADNATAVGYASCNWYPKPPQQYTATEQYPAGRAGVPQNKFSLRFPDNARRQHTLAATDITHALDICCASAKSLASMYSVRKKCAVSIPQAAECWQLRLPRLWSSCPGKGHGQAEAEGIC